MYAADTRDVLTLQIICLAIFIMNKVPQEKKDSVTKTLAILGFVAIVIFIVWLAVQVVALIPSAFSSLASIADSVYGPGDQELVVSTRNSVVNAGESFTVNWSELPGDGRYGFSYQCAEGVSLDIRTENGATRTVDCGELIDLEDATEVNVIVNAERERFTDVEYAITYMQEGAENTVTDSVITVVNTSIPTGTVVATDDTEETQAQEPEDEPEPTETTPTEPETTTTSPGRSESTYRENFTFRVPQSDPNGVVDLYVMHMGVGTVDRAGYFTPRPYLEEDEGGAIRFAVVNVGSKTATDWGYEADLPSGDTYESDDEAPLRPGERSIITLGFAGLTGSGLESFGVGINAAGDINQSNNRYEWVVEVAD